MKLGLIFGSVVFLIAGISLLGNSSEVNAQSDLERAKDILSALTNATANATANATVNATANATANVMKKTEDLLGSAPNATEGGLKKYDNPRYGISFTYPAEWGNVLDDCPQLKDEYCGPQFAIMVNDTTAPDAAPLDKLTSAEIIEKFFRSIDLHAIGVLVFKLDKPSVDASACNCSTLKDFLVWDYAKTKRQGNTFINDNATTISSNYSAWQTETMSILGGVETKTIYVYAINGDVGYRFQYMANQGTTFDRYLEGFKDMLKTVTFYPAEPEKQPSFLNSSDIANLPSTPTAQDESIKILSSNDFIDSIGYLHVVGEIENNTPANIQFVKVTGTFYDSSNQVVATDFTYTNPSDIGPGQKAPFELTLLSASIPVSQIDHYNLIASYQ